MRRKVRYLIFTLLRANDRVSIPSPSIFFIGADYNKRDFRVINGDFDTFSISISLSLHINFLNLLPMKIWSYDVQFLDVTY